MSIYGETPGGAVNGTNKVFTTAQPYISGSTRLFVNGARQDLGAQYTESSASHISFITAPSSGSTLLIDYDTAGGANYPMGEWVFNPAGYAPGAALYTGPMLFPAGINPGATQTAQIVLGPGGAQATIPPVFDGQPGLSPDFTFTATTLDPGESATVTPNVTNPGGPGVASAITLDFGIPKGDTGAEAPNTLISPQPVDLRGTPATGYMISYNATYNEAEWQPIPIAAWGNVINIPATGTTAGQVRTLCTLGIPALPFSWQPIVFARSVITGTVNTQVNLVARLGGAINQTSGAQVALGAGFPGTVIGTNPCSVQAQPEFGGVLQGSPAFAQVTAGSGATIYLNAEQQAATVDKYSTGVTTLTFGVAALAP